MDCLEVVSYNFYKKSDTKRESLTGFPFIT